MRNTYTAVSSSEYRQFRGQKRRGLEVLHKVLLFSMNGSGRPARDLGTVNDRKVRGGAARSLHAVGRAGDVGVDNYSDGLWLFLHLVAAAELIGLDETIFWGMRFDASSGKVKRYFGLNQHRDHVHYAIDPLIADSAIPTADLTTWFAGCLFGRDRPAADSPR